MNRKRVLLIIGGVVSAFVLVAAGVTVGLLVAGPGDDEQAASTPSTSTTIPSASAPTEYEEAPSADEDDSADDADVDLGIVGDGSTEDGDIEFEVLSLEAVSSIATGEFSEGPVTPGEGAKLIKVVIRWTNNGTTSADIFCGGAPAVLLDQEDNNYDATDDTTDIAGNDTVCGDGVNPGFSSTTTIGFEIPEDRKTASIALWDSDEDDDPTGESSYALVSKSSG